jgi:DnaK suppressor protein
MATSKKTKDTIKKPDIKSSSRPARRVSSAKTKKTVLSAKQEKVSSKTAAPPRIVKKSAQKLSSREAKIQQIRLKLLQQRETLLSEAELALNELPGQTIFPDLGDQASAETDRNFMLRLRGREQRLLKKIDQALERVDAGTFGICEDCGNEINLQRLEARPVTTMCIDCKTLQEEEERLRES